MIIAAGEASTASRNLSSLKDWLGNVLAPFSRSQNVRGKVRAAGLCRRNVQLAFRRPIRLIAAHAQWNASLKTLPCHAD